MAERLFSDNIAKKRMEQTNKNTDKAAGRVSSGDSRATGRTYNNAQVQDQQSKYDYWEGEDGRIRRVKRDKSA